MSYALIDNATLTAVQRLTGQVKTRSRHSTDTDIVALENMVQSILFYNQVIAVDDYIPAFREDRISHFSFIEFIDSSKYNIDKISIKAKQIADSIEPEIRGGEFANEDFRKLIELLDTHIICTWDINSSIYYLTLKGLVDSDSAGFKKYGNLSAAIFNELRDATETGNRINGNVLLFDRFGNPITSGYKVPNARWGDGSTNLSMDAIKAFVAGLVWLADRSIFYSLTARYLQADPFLYPIRQGYQQYYISKTCGYGPHYPKQIVEQFSKNLGEDIYKIGNADLPTATAIDIPLFSAWLAMKTGDVADIISAAIEIKMENEFVEIREQLGEIRNLLESRDIASANKKVVKIMREVEKISIDIKRKFSIETKQGTPLTRLVQIYNSVASLQGLPSIPEFNTKLSLPRIFTTTHKRSGFSTIYRNVTNDLAQVWALGEAREILGSRVEIDDNVRSYNPKNEEPRYRHSQSSWKSPM